VVQQFALSAALSGSGVLSAAALAQLVATANLSGSGLLSAAVFERYAKAGGLSSSGALTAVAYLATEPSTLPTHFPITFQTSASINAGKSFIPFTFPGTLGAREKSTELY